MKKVLLVEDNENLRMSLATLLAEDFSVTEAGDGEEGLRKALKDKPDIIVSDIMMPGMDGYELVAKLRRDPKTEDIPIILLTALGEEDNQIQGFELGADDYIVKPFKSRVLLTRIQNLLSQRDNLKKIYSRNNDGPEAQFQVKDPLLALVESLLVDKFRFKNVSIPDMATLMNMTPSKLEREIKRLTGMPPLRYINEYKLDKARYLIQNTDMKISEISYMLGFKSLSYFGKCYKAKFGEAPSSTDLE
jgi:DNA-binding response OmpR family regulator